MTEPARATTLNQMDTEPKPPAQAFDELKAELTQPDAVVCWSQFLREQDERERHQGEGMTALGTPEGLASDEDGRCEPGESSPPTADR